MWRLRRHRPMGETNRQPTWNRNNRTQTHGWVRRCDCKNPWSVPGITHATARRRKSTLQSWPTLSPAQGLAPVLRPPLLPFHSCAVPSSCPRRLSKQQHCLAASNKNNKKYPNAQELHPSFFPPWGLQQIHGDEFVCDSREIPSLS